MATVRKILGQGCPNDTSNLNIYTVGASVTGGAIVSTLAVCNNSASAATHRVFARINGATAAASVNALVYDVSVPANDTFNYTLGICLAAGDILTVRSASANLLVFTAFGSETIN